MINCTGSLVSFEDCEAVVRLERIESKASLKKAQAFLEELLESGSVRYREVRKYYRTLVILVAEAECYFDAKQTRSEETAEDLSERFDELLDLAQSALSEFELQNFLSDMAVRISNKMYAHEEV